MRVIIQGRLKQRSYEDREGVKRTVFEVDVEELGVSLKNATAKVTKANSGGRGQQEYQKARQTSSQEGRQDPGGSPPGGQQAGSWGGQGGYSDEAPF